MLRQMNLSFLTMSFPFLHLDIAGQIGILKSFLEFVTVFPTGILATNATLTTFFIIYQMPSTHLRVVLRAFRNLVTGRKISEVSVLFGVLGALRTYSLSSVCPVTGRIPFFHYARSHRQELTGGV